MSLTGKGTLSLRKKDVQQQKSAGTAYRRLMFAHKANAGETGINLTALIQPSEMAALGFVNPNAGDILAANILFYKKNLTVISSARGILMQDLSYTVPTSSRIEFQGFTALQDEIFTCVLETGVKDGLTLLDAAPLVSTGTLLAGQTDYNVGTPFKVGEYINSQHGAVMVSVDGQLMLRNTSNQPAGVGIQGDYYEVNNGSGLGTIIRFNTPDLINDRSVSVVSIGSLVERPDGSMTAAIESLAGQIDQMIPTLAAVAGVPENTFQGAPNNQDLKAFGDRVLSLEQSTDARLDALEARKYKYQIKTLAANVSSNGVMPSLTFNNLVVGQTYELRFYARVLRSAGADVQIDIKNGSTIISYVLFTETTTAVSGNFVQNPSIIFIATATDITFTDSSGGTYTIRADGSAPTSATLIERPDLQPTTDWT